MIIEMAPMEGITNYIYRQTFARIFGGVDRYYTPFLSPNQHDSFQTKEWNEILPEHNHGLTVVPQILTRVPEHFLWAANTIAQRGYDEVNLNAGCPSGTVVAKGKGSGMLRDIDELDRFLEAVFEKCPVKISVKSRIGLADPEEFAQLFEVYNRYPLASLIIHPRVQKEFYKGSVHKEIFQTAYENASMPLVFNGNLFSLSDIEECLSAFPSLEGIMLGRGLLSRPSLALEAKSRGSSSFSTDKTSMLPMDNASLGIGDRSSLLTMDKFAAFHQALLEENAAILSGDHPVLHRLKEFWPYWYIHFTNGEKYWKKIRKAKKLSEYLETTNQLFAVEQLVEGATFSQYSIR